MIVDYRDGSTVGASLHRPGLVAGIGLRATASLADILTLLDACLLSKASTRQDLVALATLDKRSDHPALLAVSRQLGLPILALAPDHMRHAVPNPSRRVADLAQLPSVAEAAALALGPLVLNKRGNARVTCALSSYCPGVEAGRSRASSAASTLATSSAGP